MKLKKILAVLFWLAVWQAAAMLIDNDILLASPIDTAVRFAELSADIKFWGAAGFTFIRICAGLLIGIVFGVLLAACAYRFSVIRILLEPVIRIIKTVPVASFVIIALVWISSRNLSVFISFLMVVPVIYTNTLEGISNTDRGLLDMARVFRIGSFKRILYIYLPSAGPYFISACTVSLGLCWKAGVAAEVIGIPSGSLGARLYESKLYLDTPGLFAYTALIVLISIVFEKAVVYLLRRFERRVLDGYKKPFKKF